MPMVEEVEGNNEAESQLTTPARLPTMTETMTNADITTTACLCLSDREEPPITRRMAGREGEWWHY